MGLKVLVYHKAPQSNDLGATTLSIMTFSITTLSIMGLVMTLSINGTQHRHLAYLY